MIRRFVLPLATLALALAAPAFAGAPVSLNANLVDDGGQVTLGELFDDAGPARNVVVAERHGPTLVLDAVAVQAFAHRYGLDWDNPTGIRHIIVHGQRPQPTGKASEILTYAHGIAAGQILQSSDLIWAKAVASPVDAPSGVDAVVGMAARRPLREGDAVEARDVTPPTLIKAGDTVQITYADEGITLSLQGKATTSATLGDSFGVLNTTSRRVIQAVATGPDLGVVGPEALRVKADRTPSQLASR
jgi:flagella basal body P-ring formation protein FlgA